MGIIDNILWGTFVLTLVMLILRLGKKNPEALDVDITDPLNVLDLFSDGKKKDEEVCKVCARKKGEDPLLICSHDDCINKSDKH